MQWDTRRDTRDSEPDRVWGRYPGMYVLICLRYLYFHTRVHRYPTPRTSPLRSIKHTFPGLFPRAGPLPAGVTWLKRVSTNHPPYNAVRLAKTRLTATVTRLPAPVPRRCKTHQSLRELDDQVTWRDFLIFVFWCFVAVAMGDGRVRSIVRCGGPSLRTRVLVEIFPVVCRSSR